MEILYKKENIEITYMNLNDLEQIKDILLVEFDDFWNYNVFKSELENKNSIYVIAKFNNEIIGFAGILQILDEAHIMNIVTQKKYRNRGIGKLLLETLIKISKESIQIQSLTLEVSEDNIIAQNLYNNFNFEVLGKRKKYYKDRDAIIMTHYFKKNYKEATNENRL